MVAVAIVAEGGGRCRKAPAPAQGAGGASNEQAPPVAAGRRAAVETGPLTGHIISHITLQTSLEGEGQLHVFKILQPSLQAWKAEAPQKKRADL